jgi:hypothetical protein
MVDGIDIQSEQARLTAMTVGELRAEFVKVWGYAHSTHNRKTLIRRILWREQYGPLSPEVIARAREIAAQVLVKEIPPPGWPGTAETSAPVEPVRDPRLPMPGTTLTREFRGETVEILVLEGGFEWRGEVFPSLSAVATAISGMHVNGYRFFQLGPKEKKA